LSTEDFVRSTFESKLNTESLLHNPSLAVEPRCDLASLCFAAGRLGDSMVWGVGGMFVGGIGAAGVHVVRLPVGLTIGTMIGCVLIIVIAVMQR